MLPQQSGVCLYRKKNRSLSHPQGWVAQTSSVRDAERGRAHTCHSISMTLKSILGPPLRERSGQWFPLVGSDLEEHQGASGALSL